MAADGESLVVPAGGEIIWLRDAGQRAEVRTVGLIPSFAGSERPGNFGLSIGEDGTVYQQWHRRDNTSRVEMLRPRDGKLQTDFVPGTVTASDRPESIGFCSVSLRGKDVYRCRPEQGFGLSRHAPGQKEPQPLGGFPSIASPILVGDKAIYGGLDGRLYVVPLSGNGETFEVLKTSEVLGSGKGEVWSFATAFGKAITAPACVCDGRVYFGCEDGYLYVLGPGGNGAAADKGLGIDESPQPAGRQVCRSAIRLVHQFRQLRQYQRQRPRPQAAAGAEVGPPLRRDLQAPARLRRRADVYAHRRRADLRRRAGDGPLALAALLARRPYLEYLAALPQRAPAGAAGRV